ncbi:hypothetical protein BSL78_16919 [Apostichopus japonicus]|uniref:Uncharacterized protein n=1 Tax=Stichopus japonicus TaxID=307972 RepID=A0A2G8KE36_STIJA|nr:hypothetical protein BSL78_16919 [Apostichopus japonicus]
MAVPDHLVCCDACNMWIEFEISGLECDFKSASSEAIVFVCDKCVKLKELEELLNSCSCVWTEVRNSRAVSSAVADRDCCEVVPTCNGFDVLPVEELSDVDDGNEVSQEGDSEWLVVDEVRGDCDVIEGGSVVVNSGQWGQEKSKGRMVLCGDSLVRYVDREFCRADKAKRVRVCLPGIQSKRPFTKTSSLFLRLKRPRFLPKRPAVKTSPRVKTSPLLISVGMQMWMFLVKIKE